MAAAKAAGTDTVHLLFYVIASQGFTIYSAGFTGLSPV
jgi:hypothetical protein